MRESVSLCLVRACRKRSSNMFIGRILYSASAEVGLSSPDSKRNKSGLAFSYDYCLCSVFHSHCNHSNPD